MKPNTTTSIVALAVCFTLAARGDIIVPVQIKQSNAFNAVRVASNMLNSTGMDGAGTLLYNHDGSLSGEPTSADNSQWVTSSKVSGQTITQAVAAGKVWVVFDLGQAYDLTSIKIWNFNWDNSPGTPLTSLNNRGIGQFDVYVRNTEADTDDGTLGGAPINPTGISDAVGALSSAPVFALGSTSPWSLALTDQALAQAANDDSHAATTYSLAGNTARFIAIKADTYYGATGGVALGKVRIAGALGTDVTPPALVTKNPADDATDVVVSSDLVATFSESIVAGTGNISIRKSSDNSVVETIDVSTPGAVSAIGGVFAITRTVTLDPGTAYYVNVTAGAIQDVTGNPAAAVTGSSAWAFTTSTATPLVVENFNASGAALNGTTADSFAAAITTAGGSSTWAASAAYLENGAASSVGSGLAYLNLGTFINDTKGTTAGKFDLTMTIAETSGAWISLGFASSNTPSISQNFTTIGGRGTIIYRGQSSASGPGELDMFGGPNNTNGVDGPDANTGFRTLTVSLNLTPAGGYNASDNFGTVSWSDSVLGNLGSFTYTSTQDFGSLLVSLTNTSGAINSLAFYQTGTPANTFASWISGFSVGGQTGINDDFDNDGLDNAIENLMGTSPETFNQGLTSISSSGGNLVFRHTLSATPASDLTGSYEWSTDLVTWNADEASAGGTTVAFGNPVVITPGTPDLVEITATVTGTPVGKIFARFKAAQN
jgi:hypothetical protein